MAVAVVVPDGEREGVAAVVPDGEREGVGVAVPDGVWVGVGVAVPDGEREAVLDGEWVMAAVVEVVGGPP